MGWQTGSNRKQMMGSLWPCITVAPAPPGDKEVHFGTCPAGTFPVQPWRWLPASLPMPPRPRALLLFQVPCHSSARMCFSQLSSAPAGKTKFLKHRKHPAENILIKQTPHKILFWRGKKAAPPICQRGAGRHGKTSRQAGARSSRAFVVDGSVSGTQTGAGPFNLAGIFLNRGSFSPRGLSKRIGSIEDVGGRKRCGIFETEGGIQPSRLLAPTLTSKWHIRRSSSQTARWRWLGIRRSPHPPAQAAQRLEFIKAQAHLPPAPRPVHPLTSTSSFPDDVHLSLRAPIHSTDILENLLSASYVGF